MTNIGEYFKQVSKTKLLTPEEEVELSKRVQQGDPTARNELVEANLRLVVTITKKYIGTGIPFIDLIQEGNLGLIRAAEKFDWTRGVKFCTFAAFWVRAYVLRALENKSRLIRVPSHMNSKMIRYRTALDDLTSELNRTPNRKELHDYLKESPEIVDILDRYFFEPVSLNITYGEDDTFENHIPVYSEDNTDDELVEQSMKALVYRLLALIPERDRQVIIMRYGLEGREPSRLVDVGDTLKMTLERVRQIQDTAIENLKPLAEVMGGREYL